MAYGRLEVYYPDGRIETHILTEESVSVGRAEGNTIALDSDNISRYHFSIVQQEDEIAITDLGSANGTYVDGVQLHSNQSTPLGDVEEIQVGSLRIIFRKMDDSPTMPMSALDDDTARIEREDANVRLELDRTHLDVWPAASSSSELSITNTGDETRRFSVRVSGLPGEWLRLTRPELELDSGETAYVLINIKPPRRPTTTPRPYQLRVEVTPNERPDLAIEATLDVNVRAYSGFGMAVAPQPDAGDPIPIFLHNHGSAPLAIRLSGTDPQKALNFRFPFPAGRPLEIDAGQRLRVDVQITAKNPLLTGNSTSHRYFIQAQSTDAAAFLAATEGTVRVPPRFPVWQLVTGAGILVSVLILGLLALLGLLTPADPEISNVNISGDQLARGEELVINFATDNVDTLDVYVNGALFQEDLSGDTNSVTIDTETRPGVLRVELVGENRGREARASVESFVFEPATIAEFTVEPQRLVRNVVNNLSISWNVPGATSVRISGLSDFTNNLYQSSTEYSPQDTIEGITGIPMQPLDLTLHAQDERGAPLTANLTVPIIDPQCTALRDVTLREGPDERYQQVGTVPTEGIIIVTAQDAEAGWLRVQLPGNIRGWGEREGFECASNFNVSDLRTEVNIPPLPTDAPDVPTATTASTAASITPTVQTVTPGATAAGN